MTCDLPPGCDFGPNIDKKRPFESVEPMLNNLNPQPNWGGIWLPEGVDQIVLGREAGARVMEILLTEPRGGNFM